MRSDSGAPFGAATPNGRSRTDDRPLWNVFFALRGYPAVLLAHEMKLFELLAERPRSLSDLCASLGIARRPAEALLSVCASLGFVHLDSGYYSLTPLAVDYLLPSSPTYYGWFFEAFVEPPDSLRQAVFTDRPQGPFAAPDDPFAAWHTGQARRFTRAMHSASMAAALAWPKQVDLSANRTMLDVGGGSGAHAIGAASAWPDLQAVILDFQPVCDIAMEFVPQYKLETRVGTYIANFFSDPFPDADLHFYGMVFHDWPEEQCRFLAQKSFDSMPKGGRIIVHEMLFDDDRAGPFPVAAANVDMLMAMPGEQYSGPQIVTMLADAGFTKIEIKPTFGYWSIVTALK